MPEVYGGAAFGIATAVMVQMIAESGGGMAPHRRFISIFSVRILLLSGTDEQRTAWLPPLIDGQMPFWRDRTRCRP